MSATAISLINQGTMTPKEIVSELDRYIIGQAKAKRAVAIALRNRWRRMQLDESLRQEITPKNILMIGPTGVGKTEIARRLAKLARAPFIKVEATKFTEVGYVGRDVESIIRDLVEMSIKQMREYMKNKVRQAAREAAQERVLDALLPVAPGAFAGDPDASTGDKQSATRTLFRRRLLDGELDDKEVEMDLTARQGSIEIMGPSGMDEMVSQLQGMMENLSSKQKKRRRLSVKDALKQVEEEEADKLVDAEDIKARALENVEQNGIVFIDEIDKIAKRADVGGGDVSREGVQRDLLPLVEGCTIATKYGMVKTDHILFIASGAFHLSKPSDLVPELQGRLPIRVELDALKAEDFKRILTEPNASLTEQYAALMETEDYGLTFSDSGIERIAQLAYEVNDQSENIGARRLHTMLERLLDDVSYNACDLAGEHLVIDAQYVDEKLDKLVKDENLSDYIL